MITVSGKLKAVDECIGIQTYYPWRKYKKLNYIKTLTIDDGELWYNMLTRQIIMITYKDMERLNNKNREVEKNLVSDWFMIPEDISDKTLVYSFWQSYYARYPVRRGSPLSLVTIFTTTECNARCPYCYEFGVTKNTMTKDTAELVADYIIKNSGSKIQIKWFGGEPLLNPQVMDIISKRVMNSGIEYSSYIVTNAYHMDKIKDEQLIKLWKARNVQITVDGTEERYKAIKKLPDDAYDKVIESIKRLANLKIEVMVRLHITNENFEDLKNLISELKQKFSYVGENQKYIHLYASPLFEGLGNNPDVITEELRKKIYEKYIEIDKIISGSSIDHGRGIPRIKSCHCMADDGRSIVITPTGELTPCEHCSDREIIGNIRDGGTIPEKWFEREAEIQECESCFYYPQCVRLKMCETISPCNEHYRKYLSHQTELTIKKAYEKYKNGRSVRHDKSNRNCGRRSGI